MSEQTLPEQTPRFSFTKLLLGVGLNLGLVAAVSGSALALQFSNGTTRFVAPPQLIEAQVSDSTARRLGATYAFTVRVPDGATEGLAQLRIQQTAGFDRRWFRNVRDFEAFEGEYRQDGRAIAIEAVQIEPDQQMLTIQFAEPIAEGTTLTVTFQPRRNPSTGDTYLFEVTALPTGSQPIAEFVGLGRINIFDQRLLR
ncbi:MAG: DUF2808 domain-containing protein [Cyanobacteria bacterium P01_H01_bin.121]